MLSTICAGIFGGTRTPPMTAIARCRRLYEVDFSYRCCSKLMQRFFYGLNVKIDRRAAFGASARMPGWASSQSVSEFVGRNVRLAQDASERADFDLTVHRHYATFGSAPHDDVATGLPNLRETETLKGFDDCRPGGARQLRHARGG